MKTLDELDRLEKTATPGRFIVALRRAAPALLRVARAVQQERALGAHLDSEAVANMAPDERAAAYVAWRAADQEIVAALAALETTL